MQQLNQKQVQQVAGAGPGAALYAAGVCPSILEGVRAAREAVRSGAARQKLQAFVQRTQAFGAPTA